jgi:hypothetical protein
MAVFPFTVRATDSEGSYSDRQFNITVRNSRVERFMVIDSSDAWTSPDGTTWTQRLGQGGVACAYGNGFWLIVKSGTFSISKSSDGINYNSILSANMTYLDEGGATVTAPVTTGVTRLKFFNGKFYMVAPMSTSYFLWTTVDGITWNRKTLFASVNTDLGSAMAAGSNFSRFEFCEDGDTLIIPFSVRGSTNVASGYSTCLGWTTTDGVTFNQIKNISNTTATIAGCSYLSRVNGMYIAQGGSHNNTVQAANNYIYSSDGINWTVGTYPGNAGTTSATANTRIFYSNGQLYLFTGKGTTAGPGYYYTSLDGITWTENSYKKFQTSNSAQYTYALYKNGIYLVTASLASGVDTTTDFSAPNNGFRLSVDGVNWTYVNTRAVGTTYSYNDIAAM